MENSDSAVNIMADFALGALKTARERREGRTEKTTKKVEPSDKDVLDLTLNPETGKYEYEIAVRGGGH
jgi:hypothetical protein